MKKALKVILPIFLILVLLIGGYWFFFQYRTDLTAEALAKLGDRQMEANNYNAAIRYYSLANRLAPEDVDLSFHLAQAYMEVGNYSRTERVLVNAIYAAPDDVRLYVALSKTYVAQDKLLDAQQMLDNIKSPAVLAELSSRRPAAPVLTPEGGYYSEYITVSLSPGDDAACYFTTNGQYPSLNTDAYSQPVELGGGETTVCAVAVDDEGLVSPAIYVGYTIAGVVENVTFADPVLEAHVQELLHRGNRTLQTDDLWSITELDLPEGMTTLEDLNYFTGLTRLSGRNLPELDYAPLLGMGGLKELRLEGCTLTTANLETISACPNLETLSLPNCGLSNISPLQALTGLKSLDLTNNSINSITPLTGMNTLETLLLGTNALSTLPTMKGLASLRVLDLSQNNLDSLAPLSVCTTIQELSVANNKLTSIDAVGALVALQKLDASKNQVQNVDALAGLKNLTSFTMVDNLLKSIDFLEGSTVITEINIDYNDVEAVPALPEDCPLATFSAAHNFLADLSGLSGLKQLSYVNADYNNITDISVLGSCPMLAQVNVYGTYIHDGGSLSDKGVVVNFTPSFD